MITMNIENIPIHSVKPPLVRVKGTHREIGRQIGETIKHQVDRSLDNARRLLDCAYNEIKLTWNGAKIQARKI